MSSSTRIQAEAEREHEVKTIGTHGGLFHCDEVLACYMLKVLPEYKNARYMYNVCAGIYQLLVLRDEEGEIRHVPVSGLIIILFSCIHVYTLEIVHQPRGGGGGGGGVDLNCPEDVFEQGGL